MTPPGLVELLAEHLGLAAGSLGDRVIAGVAAERMRATGAPDGAAYVRRVRADRAELDALVEAVVVPETWFFRYPKSLAYLGEWARARRTGTGAGAGRPVRIFCVPCSTGEEPYSVAIALLLAGLPAGSFAVDGCDVSARAVARATAGVYPASAFRERDAPGLDEFLEPSGAERRVRAAARQAVTLRVGNIQDAGLFLGVARYDAILCRNLFIYLTAAARRTALDRFERQLSPGGLLFMGHAEPASALDARFAPTGPPAAFAFARAAPSGVAAPPRSGVVAVGPIPVGPAAAPATHPPPAPAAPSAEAFTRRGVALLGAGDPAGAERAFTEAVYLEPRHREALAQLLALAEARGDRAAVANYRRRVGLAGGGA